VLSGRALLATATVLALVPAGIAVASSGKASKATRLAPAFGSRFAHVYGGGRFGPGTFSSGGLTFANPRDFSVDARKTSAGVNGHVDYGVNAGVLLLDVDVTCLDVRGNTAAIGGIVRKSGDAEVVGDGFVMFLADNGPPTSAARDRSSAAFIDPLSAPEWPSGFPRVCPAANGPFNAPGYLDVHSGDIVVQG